MNVETLNSVRVRVGAWVTCGVGGKDIVAAAEAGAVAEAFTFAALIAVVNFSQALVLQQFIHGSFMSGSRVVTAATSVVFHATQVSKRTKSYLLREGSYCRLRFLQLGT